MKGNKGLITSSGRWDELVVIHHSDEYSVAGQTEELSREISCQICGDEIGFTVDGEPFVACNECGFPICTTCYDYERQEGSQLCPRCKTRFKRIKGFARVDGDEEEDDADDVENEFSFLGKRIGVPKPEKPLHDDRFSSDSLDAERRFSRDLSLVSQKISVHNDGHMIDTDVSEHLSLVPFHRSEDSGERKRNIVPFFYPDLSASRRSLDPFKDLASYGYGSVAWKERVELWKQKQEKLQIPKNEGQNWDDDGECFDQPLTDEARQPLSRKLPIPSSKMNPYRMIIIIRLVVLGFFLHYRLMHPVKNAFGLWLVSVICEIWFAVSWILDQFPKWFPLDRETYLDRLSLRYEKEGEPSQLSPVDIFVSTVDPIKEPPLVTANTVLSILAVDYPVDKVSCYVSDDGADILTFEVLSETSDFAKKWVPFCKKFNIEPRAPEWYFFQKIDYLNDMVLPSFVRERRAMKREYEEFKVRINALVSKAQKVPEEGWIMQDGTPWPGNNVEDHPGMIQVFLGHNGEQETEGNYLPRLVYVSREKKPGFNHHEKAGAMNALVRVSAVLSNATYLLNLEWDHYINNSKALKEAMCFMMDPLLGTKVCYVQFPQRYDGIDRKDPYATRNTLFSDVNMKGLDGIQGPTCIGTGCVFRRKALYGYDAPKRNKPTKRTYSFCQRWCCCGYSFSVSKKKKKAKKSKSEMKQETSFKDETRAVLPLLQDVEESGEGDKTEIKVPKPQNRLEKRFGQSPVFAASTSEKGRNVKEFSPGSLLKEAIHVISCGYEDKTEWGKEVGWIYGSVTEDILTGLKMHCHGWRSIYCNPERPAFKGSAPINLSDSLHQVLHCALGSMDIFLSRHCPLWYGYGGGLKFLERLPYINAAVYPLTSLPLVAYCTLHAVCLLTGKFIIPEFNTTARLWFLSLFVCAFATSVLEMRWSGVSIDEWWRKEQFWVIGGVSAHLVAVFQGLLKVLTGVDSNLILTSKAREDEDISELYAFKWTTLLIPPTTLLLITGIGVVVGVSNAVNDGSGAWEPLIAKLLFALWVLVHLYPFLKGLVGLQNRTPTIIVLWSLLIASVFSLLWIRIDPFLPKSNVPALEECGLDCSIL